MSLAVDIVLVAPPLIWGQESRRDMKPPLNLLALATWLNHWGYTAQVIDVQAGSLTLDGVLRMLYERRPRCAGVPFYQATRSTALELCRAVRRCLPDTWIIAGGALVTTFYQSFAGLSEMDICVIGEGELTLQEVLLTLPHDARRSRTDVSQLSSVRGLAYLNHGRQVLTEPRERLKNLDTLPFLNYRLIDIEAYFRYHASLEMSDWLFMTTSRGCQARCSFCATPVLWPGGLRRQSAVRVLAEMAWQRMQFPTAQFGFMDDSFFLDKAWLKEFFAGVRTMQVRYCCIGRIDHLTEAEIRELADTGCVYVAFGVETGNQQRQKALHKGLDLELVRTQVRLLAEHQVFSKGFFMLGFPDETPAEMLETMNLAVELKTLGMGECSFFPVSVYPGTELATPCPQAAGMSGVYQSERVTDTGVIDTPTDVAERKLLRYANIPQGDVNQYYSSDQMLEVVRLAYRAVDQGRTVSLAEMPPCAEKTVPGR